MRTYLLATRSLPAPAWDIFLEPFNRFSPFRRPIGTGAQYAGDSHAMTIAWNRQTFNNVSTNNGIGYNIYVNSPNDPLRTIEHGDVGTGENLPVTVRAPFMRNPDPTGTEADSATILFDTVGSNRAGPNTFLEFARFRGGTASPWTSRALNIVDPYGDGRDAGASAADISGVGIMWRAHELAPSYGPIRRATGITLNARTSPAQLASHFIWPAKNIDGACGSSYACDGVIPYGQLIALPPSVNINGLGLSARGLRLAAQMRDYGWYAVDNGGRNIRTDQFVASSVAADVDASMTIIWPHMRAVLNNESPATQPTCSGGGTPIAPSGAYDA